MNTDKIELVAVYVCISVVKGWVGPINWFGPN